MRICLNKMAQGYVKPDCKRVKKEGQSLCKGCVCEPVEVRRERENPCDIPVYANPRPEPRGYNRVTATEYASRYSFTTSTAAI